MERLLNIRIKNFENYTINNFFNYLNVYYFLKILILDKKRKNYEKSNWIFIYHL